MEESADLTNRSAQNAAWLLGRQFTINLIRIVTIAVLARHLAPAAFGIVALASVLLNFIVLIAEGGIGAYVIYYREEDWKDEAKAAFWFNFGFTVVQVGICLAVSPFLSEVFDHADVTGVFLALIVVFFVNQAAVIPEALIQRDLRMDFIAKRDSLAQAAGAALSILLAIRGWGVWSLVLPRLVIDPMRLIAVLWMARWVPGWRPFLGRWRHILRYTAPLMGTNLLRLISNDGDTLVVGRFVGSQGLGYYNLAWQLSNLVGRNVTATVTTVAMPAFSLIKGEPVRLQQAYLRMLRLLGAIAFPLLIALFVLAPDVVLLVYGPGWGPVVDLLRIFIVFTLVRSVTSPTGTIFNALGRPDLGLRVTVVFVPFYIVAILVGAEYGALGVATGVAVVRVTAAFIGLHYADDLIGVKDRQPLLAMFPAFAAAAGMGVVLWAIELLPVIGDLGELGTVVVNAPLGALIYLATIIAFDPASYREIVRVVRAVIPPLGRAMSKLQRGGETLAGTVAESHQSSSSA
jgi:O-antigen/teichoic acid export membrane protein